jgi:hypothetical protein
MSGVTTTNGSALISFIERAARDPGFDVAKFEALLRMQREIEQDQARRAFNHAMAQVEQEIGPIVRDRLNPAVNRKYATLEAIMAVARPVYSAHGFAVRFGCDKPPKEGWMRITCTVSHAGGYSEQNYLDAPVDVQQGARARTPVQAVGSTISYLRRYLLQMSWNIVLADDEDDDDGEALRPAAVARPAPPPKPRQAKPLVERADEQWHDWLSKVRATAAVTESHEALEEIARRPSVHDATANGPPWVQREIAALLAEHYARLAEPATDEDEPVRIIGEERLASG